MLAELARKIEQSSRGGIPDPAERSSRYKRKARWQWPTITIRTPALIRKIAALPGDRIAEVEDFVEFLAMKDSERTLTRVAAATSAPAFAAIWNNLEDDVYDAL